MIESLSNSQLLNVNSEYEFWTSVQSELRAGACRKEWKVPFCQVKMAAAGKLKNLFKNVWSALWLLHLEYRDSILREASQFPDRREQFPCVCRCVRVRSVASSSITEYVRYVPDSPVSLVPWIPRWTYWLTRSLRPLYFLYNLYGTSELEYILLSNILFVESRYYREERG